MQRAADAAINESVDDIEKTLAKQKVANYPLQGALVAIDPRTGEVRAMGGARLPQQFVQRAMLAKRQQGSAFKRSLRRRG